ncbi:uncharacterized protein LOC121377838 [Gigantopelta aegis]|uniref:uncharacterized protein LOC121377838 n=1 Tax=Gigantopelta aegis TaxID=1735272 RepID=UPI001B8888BD|nr:uncharacterized protein LOC121377838 [Gigantopelta aegis]
MVYNMCVSYECLFESAKKDEQTGRFKKECLKVICALRNDKRGFLVIHTRDKPPMAWSLDGFDQLINEDCSMMVEDDTLYTENYKREWYEQQQGGSMTRLPYLVITVKPSSSISTYDFKTKVTLDGAKVRPTARQIGTYLKSVGRKRKMQAEEETETQAESEQEEEFEEAKEEETETQSESEQEEEFEERTEEETETQSESEPEQEFKEGTATNIYESRSVQIKRLSNKDIEQKCCKGTGPGTSQPAVSATISAATRPTPDTTQGIDTAPADDGSTIQGSDTRSDSTSGDVPMDMKMVAECFVDRRLPEYLTIFAKLPGGGSFYCGIDEGKGTPEEPKRKRKKPPGTLNIDGTKTGENIVAGINLSKQQKKDLKKELRRIISEKTGWYKKMKDKYKKLDDKGILKYTDIKFHPTEKREAQGTDKGQGQGTDIGHGKRKYVIQVSVNRKLKGIVFYTDDSYPAQLNRPIPLSFEFANESKEKIVDTDKWFTDIEKAATK